MALRIKALRIDKGLTQQELADRAAMSRSQLAQIEAETRPANTLRLNAIAAALNVTIDELFAPQDDVQSMVEAFKRLSESDRDAVLRMARALSRSESAIE